MDGDFIAKHKCCADVEKMMGTYQGAMVHVMYESKTGAWKGYRWSFEPRTKEYWMTHNEKGSARRHPVLQYTAGMDLVNRFKSINEAAAATGINRVTISTCCQRCYTKTKTGYLWRYE